MRTWPRPMDLRQQAAFPGAWSVNSRLVFSGMENLERAIAATDQCQGFEADHRRQNARVGR